MNYVLIFAGGTGSRMNSETLPKQYMKVNGKEILAHTIQVFQEVQVIDKIVLVILEGWEEYTKALLEKYNFTKVVKIITGGDSALNSQFKGLEYLTEISDSENDIVLIHDGVRPIIDEKLIVKNIKSVIDFGSAITTSPAIETIVVTDSNSNEINEIISRDSCSIAKAPQSFYLKDIYNSHLEAIDQKFEYIDSASMMMGLGKKINMVSGASENIKVTTPIDFYLLKSMLSEQEAKELYGVGVSDGDK